MVKLDVTLLRYLNRDDFRALTAVEMGMRNHELVPRNLIYSISGINNGSIAKLLLNLTQNRLLTYERGKRYDGYRLTYRGYDYLALNVLRTRGVLSSIGNQIGVGKESDVYVASNDEGRQFAIKFHRLGRTCFRKVSEKRDYQKNHSHKTASWLYLSRLAAIREFAFMKLLWEKNLLPIPEPIDFNRHCIVMELIDGSILNHVSREDMNKEEIENLYEKLMQIIMKLANDFGVVHGDFNEFNILIKNNETRDPVMIDFPQMISVNHELAQEYFDRDVLCIVDFFVKRFNYESDFIPCFETLEIQDNLNSELKNIADIFEDEDTMLKHLEKSDQKAQPKVEASIPLTNDSNIEQTDMMSKFLNSLSTNTKPVFEELYYEQMNEQLIKEAQDKVILENKLHGLTLTNIEESKENDKIAEVIDANQLTNSTVMKHPTENQFDKNSVHAYSTASTFSPHEVKSRLMNEKKKREVRQRMKVNPKNIKGDANALMRKKKNDQSLANEDLKGYLNDSFW